jgi:hypothetical protein
MSVPRNNLTEWTMKTGHPVPIFETVAYGPPHDPQYHCTVSVAGKLFTGVASRKKEAEALACVNACLFLFQNDHSNSPQEQFTISCSDSVAIFIDVENSPQQLDVLQRIHFHGVQVFLVTSRKTNQGTLELIDRLQDKCTIISSQSMMPDGADIRIVLEIGKLIHNNPSPSYIYIISGDHFALTTEEVVSHIPTTTKVIALRTLSDCIEELKLK